MQIINALVLNVEGRQTRNGKAIYDVAMSDGQTYSTFNNAIATAASQLKNQNAQATVEVKQSGQFTNYSLIAIQPAAGAVPQAAVAIPVAAPAPSQGGGGRGRDPEVEARIVRQSVMSTAFNFVGHVYTGAGPEALGEAKAQAIELAKHLFQHAFGGAENTTPIIPTATTAPEVAAQVNQVVGGAVQVGAAATPDW